MTGIDVGRLVEFLAPDRVIARKVVVLEEAGSTNDEAHERAMNQEQEGLVVLAEHQTAGRGQRGRVWSAPARSSLLFSVALVPPSGLASPSFLTAWGASAICEEARARGLAARIKWPNDVLIEGKKVCGILVERRVATVVGMGLNVNLTADDFPSELRLPATSLQMELERVLDRTEVFAKILTRLDVSYRHALAHGPDALHNAWPGLAEELVEQMVRVTTASGSATGRLVSLRPDEGAILLNAEGFPQHFPPEMVLRVEKLEG